MKDSFEDILTSTLEVLDQNPDIDIDVLADMQSEKYAMSQEAKETFDEASACLDKFAELGESMAEARKDGLSRGQWFVQNVERVTEGLTQDEKDIVATAIVASMEQHIDKEIDNASNLENE